MTTVDFAKLNVLIVEDNRDMRDILRRLFISKGVQVQEAADGTSGLRAHRENQCNLVLTDLEMAPMDGLEFVREVRKMRDPLTSPSVPIIMITAHTERSQVASARDAGITEFLVKPISPGALYQRVTKVMEQPRAFVQAESYLGPDRRRTGRSNWDGPFRRENDATKAD